MENTPGPGKKQCSNCKNYIGARSLQCTCGFVFASGKVEPIVVEPEKAPGAGPGKKQCSNCKNYIGARCNQCTSCGLVFATGKIEPLVPVEEKVFKNEPGPGKKQCPACKNYTGGKSQQCRHCQHTFEKKVVEVAPTEINPEVKPEPKPQPKPEKKKEAPAVVRRIGMTRIYVPGAGMMGNEVTMPHKLASNNQEDVIDWIQKTQDYFADRGKSYEPNAFKYLAGHVHEIGSAPHAELVAVIDEVFKPVHEDYEADFEATEE